MKLAISQGNTISLKKQLFNIVALKNKEDTIVIHLPPMNANCLT